MHIHNNHTDLKFNVAQLLREETGGRRSYEFAEPRLQLDEDQSLRDLNGKARFTRTASGVLVDVTVAATLDTQCTRCLTAVAVPISFDFQDEFHAQVEVNTGVKLPKPDEEDPFFINENHLLDLGEAIREYGLIELPMRPLCREACQGLCPSCGKDRNVEACNCQNEATDDRFAALRALLPNE